VRSLEEEEDEEDEDEEDMEGARRRRKSGGLEEEVEVEVEKMKWIGERNWSSEEVSCLETWFKGVASTEVHLARRQE